MHSVYIATNPSYRGLCKIGWSRHDHPQKRLKDLYTTGVLYPFELYYYVQTNNGRLLESIMHKFLDYCRVKDDREFFEISTDTAKEILIMHLKQISDIPEIFSLKEEKILLKRKRATNINLFDIGLSVGDTLYFVKNTEIKCIVQSCNTVIFENEELTLTEAARKTGLITHKELQGPKFWLFENEPLTIRRKRIELYS